MRLAVLAGTAAVLALPAAAEAAGTCAYDAGTHTLTLAGDAYGGDLAVRRDGAGFKLSYGYARPACSGGAATVTNTDTVELVDRSAEAEAFVVDLGPGPLAPGFTAEGDGSSEIEVVIRGTGTANRLVLHGSEAADALRFGGAAGQIEANLNAGEAVGDRDLTATGVGQLRVFSLDGADVLDARGGAGTGAALDRNAAMYAGGADDRLYAGAAGGQLVGGDGNDTLGGGPGPDELEPGAGDDTGDGADGSDTWVSPPYGRVDLSLTRAQDTGDGLDRIAGVENARGSGVLLGDAGPNRLEGLSGNDVLVGRGGDDRLVGGAGEDTADYSRAPGPVTVDFTRYAPHYSPEAGRASGADGNDLTDGVEHVVGSPFDDTIIGNERDNRLQGGTGDDTINGRYGDDTVDGGRGADDLSGYGGTDTLIPGSSGIGGAEGADDIDGGGGLDTVSYAARRYPVAVKLDGVRNDGGDPNRNGTSAADEEGDQVLGIENVTGGSGADRLQAFGNVANRFRAGDGDDWMDAGPGTDEMDGQFGLDTVSYAGRTERVVIKLNGNDDDGADPDGDGTSEPGEEADRAFLVENAVGGGGDDLLDASFDEAVNVLTGGPGNDFLDAHDPFATADRLSCGYGADSYRADLIDATRSCETGAP